MIDAALGSLLARSREDWNARFARARQRYPDLDAAAFKRLLAGPIDALATQSARETPARHEAVVAAAYELALELVGQRIVGADSRGAIVEATWSTLLPVLARPIAEAPERLIASITNAICNIAATPGARPAQWIEAMRTLGPRAEDLLTLVRLGQVLAWRAGLAHYRDAALALADTLPAPLALTAIGVPAAQSWSAVRARLAADPWSDGVREGSLGLREVARVGQFRGFGGWFTQPPEVGLAGDAIVVRAGDEGWVLTADAFGATLHRASEQEIAWSRTVSRLGAGLRVERNVVSRLGEHLMLDDLASIGTYAATKSTLAVTSPDTHAVVLLAWQ